MRFRVALLFLAVTPLCAWSQTASLPLETKKWGEPGEYEYSITIPKLPASHPLAKPFRRLVDRWIERETTRFGHAAESIFEEVGKPTSPYRYDVAVQSQCLTSRFVSVMFRVTEYTGGAHGNSTFRAVNMVQSASGPREIGLGDLFPKGFAYAPLVSTRVIARLMPNPKATFVSNGQMKDMDPQQLRQFSMDPGGITFWIEPYAAGPYSSGNFSVRLTPTDLAGRLSLPK
jgi:Deacetylase PdaC/Protein of unknown function (DUF3298)